MKYSIKSGTRRGRTLGLEAEIALVMLGVLLGAAWGFYWALEHML